AGGRFALPTPLPPAGGRFALPTPLPPAGGRFALPTPLPLAGGGVAPSTPLPLAGGAGGGPVNRQQAPPAPAPSPAPSSPQTPHSAAAAGTRSTGRSPPSPPPPRHSRSAPARAETPAATAARPVIPPCRIASRTAGTPKPAFTLCATSAARCQEYEPIWFPRDLPLPRESGDGEGDRPAQRGGGGVFQPAPAATPRSRASGLARPIFGWLRF